MKVRLNSDILKALLKYNQRSGEFVWKVDRNGGAYEGDVAGRTDSRGYIQIRINGRAYLAHRLAFLYVLDVWPEDQVDHINGVKTDNRWSNLRLASSSENRRNVSGRSSTGVKSVSLSKTGRFMVQITFNKKHMNFGEYKTLEEAAKVAKEVRTRLHGEFANHSHKESVNYECHS